LMKRYIEWGVDGIITDRPDLMIEVLEEMGLR
jgi:glycerophosphoryl diester phosphodiesterase